MQDSGTPTSCPRTGGTDDYFIEFLFDQMDTYVPGLADSGLVSSWLSYRAEPGIFCRSLGRRLSKTIYWLQATEETA